MKYSSWINQNRSVFTNCHSYNLPDKKNEWAWNTDLSLNYFIMWYERGLGVIRET